MAAFRYEVKPTHADSHQAVPGWLVSFVRFEHPATGYTTRSNILNTKPLMVVENDCISVEINNNKNSYAKSCTLTFKAGDVYYFNAVAPGDWVCVWIHDDLDHIKHLAHMLRSLNIKKSLDKSGSTDLNNWESGLKFIGRVVGVVDSHYMSGGMKIVTQTVHCQAFLELATSVYFTEFAHAYFAGIGPKANQPNFIDQASVSYALGRDRFKKFADKFVAQLMNTAKNPENALTPDIIIQYLIILLFGIDKTDLNELGNLRGHFNDAITVPRILGTITGNPVGNKLWQFYNFHLGLQKYRAGDPNRPWVSFNPIFEKITSNFMLTKNRCKGFILYYPPFWQNKTFWAMFNEYLNAPLNEIYTVLKCDHKNRIRPTIVVRERPFSTGLYRAFWGGYKMSTIVSAKTDAKKNDGKNTRTGNQKNEPQFKKEDIRAAFEVPRSFYCELPRWVIDDRLIESLDISVYESNRINFVQVFGKNIASELHLGPNAKGISADQEWRQAQFLLGNYVADDQDIARNGLRLAIFDTQFDIPLKKGTGISGGSNTPIWARMLADWMFNGHLKPEGTVRLFGIKEPICEGDNVEIRGVVYHIEGVTHTARMEGGRRSFMTTLHVSNGILASSLKSPSQIPAYPIHLSNFTKDVENIPGITDFQILTLPDRDNTGGH